MKRVLVALSIVLLASFASASTVDFNAYSLLNATQGVVSYQGLDFSNSGFSALMYVWDGSSPNSNGTPALIFTGGTMTMTKTGGGMFNLNRVDMALSWYEGGYSSEDITVNGSPITLIQGLQSYNLNLSGVSSVTFSGTPSGSGYWLMDNVVYNATPEPSTLITLGTGLLGLAGLARKRLFS